MSVAGNVAVMPSSCSLPYVLERMYENQVALEAALTELTLRAEQQGSLEAGVNVRGPLLVSGLSFQVAAR